MAGTIVGVNNYQSAASGRNTLEDFGATVRGVVGSEGIISGLRVTETSPQSAGVKVSAGSFAIDCGDDEFVVARLVSDISSLTVPNTGSSKYYLVYAEVDLTNATLDIGVSEGTAGTDPDLTEGGSPEVYYIPLARIAHTGGSNVTNAEIVQDGTTQTNNSSVETIGRIAGMMTGWNLIDDTATYASASTFTLPGDWSSLFQVGTKFRLDQTTDGTKYFYADSISVASNMTTVTTVLNDAYDLDNETISNLYYSNGHRPKDFPERFPYTPTSYTGFSADPDLDPEFSIEGGVCTVWFYPSTSVGTSNSSSFAMAAPIDAVDDGQDQDRYYSAIPVIKSGGVEYTGGCYIARGGSGLVFFVPEVTLASSGDKWAAGHACYPV